MSENEFSAIEDIYMIGYPSGLSDESHNFPITRKGITASHPRIDFNKKPWGVVDLACFPGSSGSPILIIYQNKLVQFEGRVTIENKMFLLGILFGGPTQNVDGEVEITEASKITVKSNVMIHLGYYVKSRQIISLISLYEKTLKV
jgi:hypothetical protein